MTYIPFEPMIERSQMTAYLEKFPICCQSGADVALTRKSHRWVVLDVRPIGGVD